MADAGPCLGFLSLGLAISELGGTSAAELRHCAVLGSAKLLLMPTLYAAIGHAASSSLSAPSASKGRSRFVFCPEPFLGVTDWDHANEASTSTASKGDITNFTNSRSD